MFLRGVNWRFDRASGLIVPVKPGPPPAPKERNRFSESWAMRRARVHDREWERERDPGYNERLAEGFALIGADGDEW
jgi:hypothetical protein